MSKIKKMRKNKTIQIKITKIKIFKIQIKSYWEK